MDPAGREGTVEEEVGSGCSLKAELMRLGEGFGWVCNGRRDIKADSWFFILSSCDWEDVRGASLVEGPAEAQGGCNTH